MKTTYADCEPGKTFEETAEVRRLDWRSDQPIPLEEAGRAYAMIPGYNEFGPHIVQALMDEFAGLGMSVTCAREFSVCLYLHMDPANADKAKVQYFCENKLDADEVDWIEEGETLRLWWD